MIFIRVCLNVCLSVRMAVWRKENKIFKPGRRHYVSTDYTYITHTSHCKYIFHNIRHTNIHTHTYIIFRMQIYTPHSQTTVYYLSSKKFIHTHIYKHIHICIYVNVCQCHRRYYYKGVIVS